jgi:hypothetical protein
MSEQHYDVEAHVNPDPRNDSQDVGTGFGVMFLIYIVIFTTFVLIAR